MRYGSIFYYFFLISILSCQEGLAQQLVFKHYTINDGLITNSIRRIYQDHKGFLWIGTWEGLSKYDGDRFTNFNRNNGLSADMINDFLELSPGSIYVATNEKATDLILDNEQIQKSILPGITINRFFKTSSGAVFALTDLNGVYVLANGRFSKPKQTCGSCNYYDMAELNDSLYVLQSDFSLQILNRNLDLFSEAKHEKAVYAESRIIKDTKGRVWVGTSTGLELLSDGQVKGKPIVFQKKPPPFNNLLLDESRINCIMEDTERSLWISTNNGLVRVNAKNNFQLFNEKNGLPSGEVDYTYQDREKNIWVGTTQGLAKLVTQTGISIYTNQEGLLSNKTRFVLNMGNAKILVSSNDGLQSLDLKANAISRSSPGDQYSWFVTNSTPPLLIDNSKGAIVTFDTLTERISGPLKFDRPLQPMFSATKDAKGVIFAAVNSSICQLMICSNGKALADSSIKYPIYTLLVDKKGYLWVGTWSNGLFRVEYEYVNNKVSFVKKVEYLPGKYVRCLYEDSQGNIWVGTRYDGVFLLDAKNNYSSSNYNQSNGLSSNYVNSIAETGNGNIWVGGFFGLDKLIPVNNLYRVFNFSRIHNFSVNINNIISEKGQTLWIATQQGLAFIRDGELEKAFPVPVYITSASLSDTVYRFNKQQVSLDNKIDHKRNRVEIAYSSPGLINEKQILYSYRLLGSSNKDWSIATTRHSVSYASLQPGNYTFEVRSLGWNGRWGDSATLHFMIAPPFWQTSGFLIPAFLLVAGMIFLAVRRRIKVIRREADMKHRISEAEMNALRAQMNPHFIFNSLNAIDNLVQTNQKEKATTYLAKFAKLIRAVLDSSKNNAVPFQKDFETLRLYLQMEQFRSSNKFEYELHADEELMHCDYKVPPLVVQPFVENALYHGLFNKEIGERRLSVSVLLEHDYMKYIICDNGIGRGKARLINSINKPEHESYGIAISSERIHLFNQNGYKDAVKFTDLFLNNEPAGTRVEIKVKLVDHTN